MPRFGYQAFGLIFSSDFPIPLLMPADGPHDVRIIKGRAPRNIFDAIINTDEIQSNRDSVLFTVKDTARFHIRNGTRIVVDPGANGITNDVMVYLLGAVFGALLFQRGRLPIHGSTLNIKGQGIIIAGQSGSGKSTLTRALLDRGGCLLSDDLIAIKTSPRKPGIAFPGFPLQKLWKDSLDALGVPPLSQNLIPVFDAMPKYQVPCPDQFCSTPLAISRIYELLTWDNTSVSVAPVSGPQKTSVIMANTYGRYLAQGLGISHTVFSQCIDLARSTRVFRILRPTNRFSAREIADAMLESMHHPSPCADIR